MNTMPTPSTMLAVLRQWHQRASSRRVLAELGARELHDIGISPGMAAFEAAKPFWKP
jgi:uncharacterized protein YjiS (DUF1127 family)